MKRIIFTLFFTTFLGCMIVGCSDNKDITYTAKQFSFIDNGTYHDWKPCDVKINWNNSRGSIRFSPITGTNQYVIESLQFYARYENANPQNSNIKDLQVIYSGMDKNFGETKVGFLVSYSALSNNVVGFMVFRGYGDEIENLNYIQYYGIDTEGKTLTIDDFNFETVEGVEHKTNHPSNNTVKLKVIGYADNTSTQNFTPCREYINFDEVDNTFHINIKGFRHSVRVTGEESIMGLKAVDEGGNELHFVGINGPRMILGFYYNLLDGVVYQLDEESTIKLKKTINN